MVATLFGHCHTNDRIKKMQDKKLLRRAAFPQNSEGEILEPHVDATIHELNIPQ